ncbi:rhodanese-like domain-containing protein [Rubrobacter aplysinae]|uniref:rhodanese-like domain-containing protein n=1 Tax=Rubrobacter aplysinae TaxID=909625 RepID=UPI00064BD14B|nr:rhodanese-like domain-containing protein [Rubrobacter aplysinae]
MDRSFGEEGLPNITPADLKRRLDAGDAGQSLQLLDVREPWEFERARIEGSVLTPMSVIAEEGMPEPDGERDTVVICHHGVRSAHIVRLLGSAGFERVLNLEGGLDSYSAADPEVPRY